MHIHAKQTSDFVHADIYTCEYMHICLICANTCIYMCMYSVHVYANFPVYINAT